MAFIDELALRAARGGRRIVLAEGDDDRVRQAAHRLQDEGHIQPILLVSDPEAVDGGSGDLRCPAEDPRLGDYADRYAEIDPEIDRDAALKRAADPLVFAALMLADDAADGVVAGAVYSTGTVTRTALRVVGADARTVSGAFYMIVPGFRDDADEEVLTFTDAGVVPDPDVEQLVEIAREAAAMRSLIVGDEPRVAFLSYSTLGSAEGPSVSKMRDALARFRRTCPDVSADGELQVDAALIESVGRRKAPHSPVAGRANVLVFPDLDAGNTAYKLVERLARATALGPILHGLSRPMNDLSRGATPDAIVGVAYITAVMAGRRS